MSAVTTIETFRLDIRATIATALDKQLAQFNVGTMTPEDWAGIRKAIDTRLRFVWGITMDEWQRSQGV
jgi:hypothetical protein